MAIAAHTYGVPASWFRASVPPVTVLAFAGLALWATILLLPWRPWSTRERLEAPAAARTGVGLTDVTALIPARNEAGHIGATLAALARQGPDLAIILVDDESDDGTAARARQCGLNRLCIVNGRPPPPGWSGKLWALEQGRAGISSEYTLLLDADVSLDPGVLVALRDKLRREDYALVSLMVELRMRGRWERLLLPAFIYFFKLLYPFALANSGMRLVAAAAGGCILLRTSALAAIGGFGALRGAIIDDCTLARRMKQQGLRTWIGLTRSARSTRAYPRLDDVWDMVARSAYTQLRYSSLLLALCTVLLLTAFAAPVLALAAGSAPARTAGLAAIAVMAVTYLPTLRYYGIPRAWAFSLPLVGLLYLGMTWASAWRYWHGERSRWKGRSYAAAAGE